MKIIQLIASFPILIIPTLFVLMWFIQIIYYLFVYIRIVFYKKRPKTNNDTPVSVVICARDEAINLQTNLPSILKQKYPNYEVIVVDDCSEDDTEYVLNNFKKEYSHLKTTTIKKDDKFFHSKKLALTIGIKAASNEWVLLTDADCMAESENWIKQMSDNFVDKTIFVLGYGGYKRERSLLNNLIRFDTLMIAIQYLSHALARKPYMGVGRNLAYRKSIFFETKGFARHSHLESGDDDLFVNHNAKRKNTKIEVSRDAITRSEAKKSLRGWLSQKRRHMSSSKLYKKGTKFRIGLEFFSRTIYYIAFVLSLVYFVEFWKYLVGVFAFRFILQFIIYKVAINRFSEKYLLIPSFFYDIILPYIYICLSILNLFAVKRTKWK